MSEQRTELSELGEFGLIDKLTSTFETGQETSALGIGDDAAIIADGAGEILVSTDMLVEGIHFDLSYVPLKHLGYKAVMVNLSDIYAMNALPHQITVSIAVSNRFPLEALEELYEGIKTACEAYKVDLVGGDTTSSKSGLVISITTLGRQKAEKISKRSGANEKDLICVTGDLGAAYLGLQILEREKTIFKENPGAQPDLDGLDYLIERQLKPEARWDIIQWFEENEVVPTSMIDISDGLASELLHICNASDKGCHIYEDKLPIDTLTGTQSEEFKISPTVCALSGGEDYELLFTAKQSDYDKLKANPAVSIIGYVMDKGTGAQMITPDERSVELTAQGWSSFS